MIYFAQALISLRVKIGHTEQNVTKRVSELQIGSPEPLDLLGFIEGDRTDEKRLHKRFAAHHVHGEWFELGPALAEALREFGLTPFTRSNPPAYPYVAEWDTSRWSEEMLMSRHLRYHVKRNIVASRCSLCRPAAYAARRGES